MSEKEYIINIKELISETDNRLNNLNKKLKEFKEKGIDKSNEWLYNINYKRYKNIISLKESLENMLYEYNEDSVVDCE